jgi:phosphoglucosamine mutase
MLEAALVAGITSVGGDALLAGIIPTPAVALLTRELAASGGVVISASHNPPEYNGIKFFDAEGFKLTAELENAFEERLQEQQRAQQAQQSQQAPQPQPQTSSFAQLPTGAAVGTVVLLEDANERYIAHAMDIVRLQGFDLTGMVVAVDCGHGASFLTTPEALRRLGAEVATINTDYDGNNINVACGSTHLDQLKALVVKTGAAVGIAHDGDADRMLAVDEMGNELDGDYIEAICALSLKEQGRLSHDTVVSTVLCNCGFVTAMRENGIQVVQTDVGDSHVLAAMKEGGFVLGGEQSGHMILFEHNSTGDGLATALQLLVTMKRTRGPLSQLAHVMVRYPQVLINSKVTSKDGIDSSISICQAIEEATMRLGEQGRVLLRPSGTEPLVRIMVEAANEQVARDEAKHLAALVEQEFGVGQEDGAV